jgi:hypothetical protein
VQLDIQLKSFINKELFLRPFFLAKLLVPLTLNLEIIHFIEWLEEIYSDLDNESKPIEFIKKELYKPITVYNEPSGDNQVQTFTFKKIRGQAWQNYNRIKDFAFYPKIIGNDIKQDTPPSLPGPSLAFGRAGLLCRGRDAKQPVPAANRQGVGGAGIYIYFYKNANEKIANSNYFDPLKVCYIGSSKDILKRNKNHDKKECKYYNTVYKLTLGQIYLTVDYLTEFKRKFPMYKLSKGEWIILNQLTEFYLKILEQNLINGLNPGLNTKKIIRPRYYGWKKEWKEYYDTENNYNRPIKVKIFKKLDPLSVSYLYRYKGQKIELLEKEVPLSDLNRRGNSDIRKIWKSLDERVYIKIGLCLPIDEIRIQSKERIENQRPYLTQEKLFKVYNAHMYEKYYYSYCQINL